MRTTLKDGTEADIREWDVYTLHDAMGRLPVAEHEGFWSHKTFQGFDFAAPWLIASMLDRKHDPSGWSRADEPVYSAEEDLSPLELQADRSLPNHAYQRSIVALRRRFLRADDILGVALLPWEKGNWFWHYGLMLDVHEQHRNNGVGTALLRAVDRAEFVQGKIVRVGLYTMEGEEIIAPRIERLLPARGYALILPGIVESIPRSPGIYRSAA